MLGDRWTLLIVRELMIGGACRYTDLRNGLPGIATNLLAERLRELETAGVIGREDAPPPVATTLFKLTPRGEELKPILHELGRWGIPFMTTGPAPQDVFRDHWLAWPAELFLADQEPDGPPLRIELRSGQSPLVVEAADGSVKTRPGPVADPDAVLSGSPQAILGLISGALELSDARRMGLEFEGDASALSRLRPQPEDAVRASKPSNPDRARGPA